MPDDEALYPIDEELTELELQENPNSPSLYTVRLKARLSREKYSGASEIYPLQGHGEKVEVSARAYILVPDITLTVGLYGEPVSSGAIGEVTDSQWQGMRHHNIASMRGLYYEEDRALAIWEIDAWGRMEVFPLGVLWQGFETWLAGRFPGEVVYSDNSEPFESETRNAEFLESLGYQPVEEVPRIYGKLLAHT